MKNIQICDTLVTIKSVAKDADIEAMRTLAKEIK
jgi:hypothetical protein